MSLCVAENIQPACLPAFDQAFRAGTACWTSGFGTTDENNRKLKKNKCFIKLTLAMRTVGQFIFCFTNTCKDLLCSSWWSEGNSDGSEPYPTHYSINSCPLTTWENKLFFTWSDLVASKHRNPLDMMSSQSRQTGMYHSLVQKVDSLTALVYWASCPIKWQRLWLDLTVHVNA